MYYYLLKVGLVVRDFVVEVQICARISSAINARIRYARESQSCMVLTWPIHSARILAQDGGAAHPSRATSPTSSSASDEHGRMKTVIRQKQACMTEIYLQFTCAHGQTRWKGSFKETLKNNKTTTTRTVSSPAREAEDADAY